MILRTTCSQLAVGFVILTSHGCGPILAKGADPAKAKIISNTKCGIYFGSWSASNGDAGLVSLSVSDTGSISGEETETGYNVVGRITGSIDALGGFRAQCAYPRVPVDHIDGRAEFIRDELIISVNYHHPDTTVRQTYRLRRRN